MRRLLLSLTALLALALPATAGALGFDTYTPDPLTVAIQRAEQYWGQTPCDGQIKFEATSPSITNWPDAAISEWESPLGHDIERADPATYTDCTTILNGHYWVSWLMEGTGEWPMFCQTITHELGHLLGHLYSANPRSVMYWWFDGENVPSDCGYRLWRVAHPFPNPDRYEAALPATEWAGGKEEVEASE
jgi:hypothetical protein